MQRCPARQAPLNVGFTILGWIYGDDDFGKSICIAIGCGDDTGGSYRFVGAIDDAAFFPAELPALLVQQCRDAGAARTARKAPPKSWKPCTCRFWCPARL